MLVRQSKNTFIRSYFGKGYISNQLTRFDRIYNETGADFLSEISRTPQNVDSILDRLKGQCIERRSQKRIFGLY